VGKERESSGEKGGVQGANCGGDGHQEAMGMGIQRRKLAITYLGADGGTVFSWFQRVVR